MATTYDAIVIGTGQAGPSLAVRLAGAGMKAAIIERKQFGGICVNVGGRASTPPLRGLDQVSYLNNSTMMEVDFLPEHLIVIGGSYVGLEFAQMYRRFGSEVTIVEMGPRLIQREDEDVSEAVRTILEAEDIKTRLSAECIALEKRGDKVAVGVDCTSGDKIVIGSHVIP